MKKRKIEENEDNQNIDNIKADEEFEKKMDEIMNFMAMQDEQLNQLEDFANMLLKEYGIEEEETNNEE